MYTEFVLCCKEYLKQNATVECCFIVALLQRRPSLYLFFFLGETQTNKKKIKHTKTRLLLSGLAKKRFYSTFYPVFQFQ